jgi:hypothetical protein
MQRAPPEDAAAGEHGADPTANASAVPSCSQIAFRCSASSATAVAAADRGAGVLQVLPGVLRPDGLLQADVLLGAAAGTASVSSADMCASSSWMLSLSSGSAAAVVSAAVASFTGSAASAGASAAWHASASPASVVASSCGAVVAAAAVAGTRAASVFSRSLIGLHQSTQ